VRGRLNASVLAVKNCKRKATELAQAVSSRLGPVLAVREDYCKQSSDDNTSAVQNQPVSVQERLQMAALHITAKATVTFQLRPRVQKDHKLS